MIDQNEIKSKAIEFDIHHANVERDYVFGWLLKSIYENDYLRHKLIFKGGNCLRKAFYSETRFSADLDFSVSEAVETDVMATQINNACREAQANCGVEFLIHRNTFVAGQALDKDRRSYKGRVFFTDFFGKEDDLIISVKVDVTDFEKLYLSPVQQKLIHPYTDFDTCASELKCMALEEIIASKLKCLIQRRHSHDFFDLVYTTFINRSIEVDRSLILQIFLSKTIFRASPNVAKKILLGLPMTFFSGVWERYIKCPKTTRFGFERALEGFKESIESLFLGETTSSWDEQFYFGSQYRNLILDAGLDRRLMKMHYQGTERIIEPYSLTYKKPAGKPAREYFYAYDRTGGSSGPGLKAFVNENVQQLSITEESFDPRYEIELSKAGEVGSNGYFGNTFRNSLEPNRVRNRKHSKFGIYKSTKFNTFQQTYKIQCPYCQKIFRRKSNSLTLNDHKTPEGYRCGGRKGYLI